MQTLPADFDPARVRINRRLPVGPAGLSEALAAQLRALATAGCRLCGGSGVSGYRRRATAVEVCKCAFPGFDRALRAALAQQHAAALGRDAPAPSPILGLDGRPAVVKVDGKYVIGPEEPAP